MKKHDVYRILRPEFDTQSALSQIKLHLSEKFTQGSLSLYNKKGEYMRIAIFEDEKYRQLKPMIHLQPVFKLRSGIIMLYEKVERRLNGLACDWFVRARIQPLLEEQHPERMINQTFDDEYLFINARLIVNDIIWQQLEKLKLNTIIKANDELLAVRVSKDMLSEISFDDEGLLDFGGLETKLDIIYWPADLLFHYIWDLVARNPIQIENDFKLEPGIGFISGNVYEGAYLVEPRQIYIAEGANIYPGAVIVAENGPVYIDKGAKIYPNTFIEGPAFIGENSSIKAGAKIYGGTSIGEVCKIGGEVECSIIHSFSNKQHEGFLGHSYLGKWVNLGADTNNSDLKNNYSPVTSFADGKEINTGLQFVGLCMADHSKTGINTMFNTGTVAGVFCNIFGSDFPSKNIPDFSWGGAQGFIAHEATKAIETARKVMERRKKILSKTEEDIIRMIFAESQHPESE
ncbi:MAG: GlmU family protein [Bacteroidales bacterium]|nr:GlmU family protein [Bacteroidales bacterium]